MSLAEPAPDFFAEAVRLHQAGQSEEAESLYRRLILACPSHAEAWSNLGLALLARGAHEDAVLACQTAIGLWADYPDAHLNLVTALTALGRLEEAAPVYRRAAQLLPERADLPANLGVLLDALGQPVDALAAYREALRRDPAHRIATLSAGRLLTAAGRLDEAAVVFWTAVNARPEFVEALSNLGTVLGALGRYGEAAAIAVRAHEMRPDSAEIACNTGVALQQNGLAAEAVVFYERAIALDPAFPGPYANLGVALQELLRFDEAVDAFARAVALNPDFHTAVVEAIKVRRHICDWRSFEADRQTLLDLLEARRDVVFMLLLMSFASSPAQQFACARLSMARLNAVTQSAVLRPTPAGAGRIRVGYLSHDFREHPVGRLLPELFARHDRSHFEVSAYAIGKDDPGPVRRRIRDGVEHFVDLQALSDQQAADRIAADGIDILVDLTGPTIGSRLAILALRPAPVQVSFLGWPGTMGLDAIDYLIADRVLVRPGEEQFYAEKIVRLPHAYQPSDGGRGALDVPVTRAECGLPERGFVFCSFNNTSKITPSTFACWMRVLGRVPGSVLWLYCKTPQTIANLQRQAEAEGIAADRIVFAGFAATDLYLSRFRLADLFLDSLPYTAGATCNDALWAGLPVLTCTGDTYVGRMAGSLLTTLGLTELVTDTPEAYEAVALKLATTPRRMAALRRKLVKARDASPLFDMTRFAAHLEAAYAAMHGRSRSGQNPDHIDVDANGRTSWPGAGQSASDAALRLTPVSARG